MPMKQLNIVMHAGKDAYHFEKARTKFSEKDHLSAIAEEMYQTGKYSSYTAAMSAATGVYDYQIGLAEGNLINRAARMALRAKALPDDTAVLAL